MSTRTRAKGLRSSVDASEGDKDDKDKEESAVEERKNNSELVVNDEHNKQGKVVDEEEEENNSKSDGDSEASNNQDNMDLGEKQPSDSYEKTVAVNAEEDRDSFESESVSDGHQAREDEQGKSGGVVQSGGVVESKSQGYAGQNKESSSSSGNVDSDDKLKQIVVRNQEGDDNEPKSESDTKASNGQENLGSLKKKKRSNAAQHESRSSKYATRKQISKKKEKKSPYVKWNDDDVITLLEGLMKFKKDKAVKQYNRSLHNLIGDSLHFKPSVVQIKEKIRRLKIKYTGAARESHEDSSPEEPRILKLCKRIWGDGAKSKNIEQPQKNQSSGDLRVDPCSKARNLLNEGFDLVKGSKKQTEFEGDWTELQLKEIELYQEKLDLMKKHLCDASDELRSSIRSRKKAK